MVTTMLTNTDYVHYEESGKSFTHDNRGLREWENIMRELEKD